MLVSVVFHRSMFLSITCSLSSHRPATGQAKIYLEHSGLVLRSAVLRRAWMIAMGNTTIGMR